MTKKLMPYGSTDYANLVSKVGTVGKVASKSRSTEHAPYGSARKVVRLNAAQR